MDELTKLRRKMLRLERKYERLPDKAKVQKLRILKSFKATLRRIEFLTGKDQKL